MHVLNLHKLTTGLRIEEVPRSPLNNSGQFSVIWNKSQQVICILTDEYLTLNKQKVALTHACKCLLKCKGNAFPS